MVLGGSSDQGGPKPAAPGLPVPVPRLHPEGTQVADMCSWDASTRAQLPTTRSLTSSGRRSADQSILASPWKADAGRHKGEASFSKCRNLNAKERSTHKTTRHGRAYDLGPLGASREL